MFKFQINRKCYIILKSRICSKELKAETQRYICVPTFRAALFIISKKWKQPKCPSMDEWINKMWYIRTMEYFFSLEKEGNSGTCYNMDES